MRLTINDMWRILSPDKIINELLAAFLALSGYYYTSSLMSTTGEMAYFANIVTGMYWVTYFVVFFSWLMASLKSGLPALLLLIGSICLPFFGYEVLTEYACCFGVASMVIFGIAWRLKINVLLTE